MRVGLVECFVVTDKINRCEIETNEQNLVTDVYWSYETSSFDRNDYVGKFHSNSFEFERTGDPYRRVYYHLVLDDGTTICFGERILSIPGMYNFRDMGGYPTVSGKRVRWGVLYRGDQLFNLDKQGDDYVRSLNLRTVLDLRSDGELESYPNRIVDDVIESYQFDPNAHIAAFAGSVQNNEFGNEKDQMIATAQRALADDPIAGESQMIKQQKMFVVGDDAKKAFKGMLEIALDYKNAPLFQHCKGGKDRTGYAAYLELSLLGVSDEYIIKDYMLTRVAREQKNKLYYERFLKLTGSEEYANFFYSLFDTKESYILSAINEINESYGNMENYAITELGIEPESIKSFQAHYLES